MRCSPFRSDRAVKCRLACLPAVIIGLAVVGACSKPVPPPLAYAGPTLASADFGLAEPVQTPGNGYVLLEPGRSQGRFPASLAVVRLDQPCPLAVYDDFLYVADRGWEIASLKQEEAAYWNGLLKRIPQSRSVYVLDRRSVVSPDCNFQEVIQTARLLRMELCLIYGPRMVDDDGAGFCGVLVDVITGRHLAYLESHANSADYEPPRPDRHKRDQSHQDVNYIAARRFERQVRECVRELISLDTPPATTQPSPWRVQDDRVPPDSVPVYILPNRRVGQ